jgi:hypothetical protein
MVTTGAKPCPRHQRGCLLSGLHAEQKRERADIVLAWLMRRGPHGKQFALLRLPTRPHTTSAPAPACPTSRLRFRGAGVRATVTSRRRHSTLTSGRHPLLSLPRLFPLLVGARPASEPRACAWRGCSTPLCLRRRRHGWCLSDGADRILAPTLPSLCAAAAVPRDHEGGADGMQPQRRRRSGHAIDARRDAKGTLTLTQTAASELHRSWRCAARRCRGADGLSCQRPPSAAPWRRMGRCPTSSHRRCSMSEDIGSANVRTGAERGQRAPRRCAYIEGRALRLADLSSVRVSAAHSLQRRDT